MLAVYEKKEDAAGAGQFQLKERHLYGLNRLGMVSQNVTLAQFDNSNVTNGTDPTTPQAGDTYYELTNHLGNVMAVISDKVSSTNEPTVVSLSDYYPFGMTEPGRNYDSYRYGFNSQENVPELGEGHTTALYWEYDGRLGRRWNLDPKPSFDVSSYATFANNPIVLIDILGDKCTESMRQYMEATVAEMNDKINKQQGKIDDYNNEISMLDSNKKARKIERLNANLQSVVEKKKKLENQLAEIQLEFDALKNSNQTYNLRFDPSLSIKKTLPAGGFYTEETSRTVFNSATGQVDIIIPSGVANFAHEAKHAYQFEMGLISLNVSDGSNGIGTIQGSYSFLYSLEDEDEAFARGGIFGQKKGDYTQSPYSSIKKEKRNVEYMKELENIFINLFNNRQSGCSKLEDAIDKGFQNTVNRKRSAVRYKGKTYYYDPKNESK